LVIGPYLITLGKRLRGFEKTPSKKLVGIPFFQILGSYLFSHGKDLEFLTEPLKKEDFWGVPTPRIKEGFNFLEFFPKGLSRTFQDWFPTI